MPNPKRRHSKARGRQAPHARHPHARGAGRVPAVPRAEALAPGVPALRVLPRPAGARGQGRVAGRRRRRLRHDPDSRRRDGRRSRARDHRRRGARRGARGRRCRCRWSAARTPAGVAGRAARRRRALDVAIVHGRRGRSGMGEPPTAALRRAPGRLDPGGGRAKWPRAGRRRCSAPGNTGRHGDGGARGVRHARGRRPARAGGDRADAAGAGGAARRRARTSSAGRGTWCSSRRWGPSTRGWRSAWSGPAWACSRSARRRPRGTTSPARRTAC